MTERDIAAEMFDVARRLPLQQVDLGTLASRLCEWGDLIALRDWADAVEAKDDIIARATALERARIRRALEPVLAWMAEDGFGEMTEDDVRRVHGQIREVLGTDA